MSHKFDFLNSQGGIKVNKNDESFSSTEDFEDPLYIQRSRRLKDSINTFSKILKRKNTAYDVFPIYKNLSTTHYQRFERLHEDKKNDRKRGHHKNPRLNLKMPEKPGLLRFQCMGLNPSGQIGMYTRLIRVGEPFEVKVRHPYYTYNGHCFSCTAKIINNAKDAMNFRVLNGSREIIVMGDMFKKIQFEVNDYELPYSFKIEHKETSKIFEYVVDIPIL